MSGFFAIVMGAVGLGLVGFVVWLVVYALVCAVRGFRQGLREMREHQQQGGER
jgi:hypothetical protein